MKIIKILFVIFLILAGSLLAGAFLFTKPVTLAILQSTGHANISFENIRLTPQRVEVQSLSMAGIPPVTVEAVSLDWTFPAILDGKIKLGEFKNAVVAMPTLSGPVSLTASGTVDMRGDEYQLNATINSETPQSSLAGQFTGNYNPITHGLKASLEIADGKLTLPDVDIKRLGGWISIEGATDTLMAVLPTGSIPVINGQLTAGNINLKGLPFKATTLSLSSSSNKIEGVLNTDIASKNGSLSMNIKVDGTGAEADTVAGSIVGNLKNLDALGRKDITGNGDINATFTLSKKKDTAWNDPTAWGRIKLRGDAHVKNLSLADMLSETSGTIGISTRVDPGQADLSKTGADILIKSFSGSIKGTPFSDINSVLHLDRVSPPVFQNQKISIGFFNAGLPLTNGQMDLSLDARRNLTFNAAAWDVAKGRITAAPFILPLDTLKTDVTLHAENIDLPELFKLAPMDGLDATGTVNGNVPVKIDGDTVAIVDGVLETTGPGAIRYNPQNPPAFLKDNANQQIIDLRVALKAFDYETLKLVLNGELGKSQKISLQAKGKNPEFYKGHPVNINFNVEGPLDNVLKYSPGGSQIPDNIQKQIESYEKEHAEP